MCPGAESKMRRYLHVRQPCGFALPYLSHWLSLQNTNNIFQNETRKRKRGKPGLLVVADSGRKRTRVCRQHLGVGTVVTVDFNDKLHRGVVVKKGPGGEAVVSYTQFPGQFQEYEKGELHKYTVRGAR